jgi:hypothetical protein
MEEKPERVGSQTAPDAAATPQSDVNKLTADQPRAPAELADRVETNGAPPTELAVDGRAEEDGWTGATAGSGMFPELVRAHYEWEQQSGANGNAGKRYRATLEAFERREGELVHVYWARKRPSAVALTVKPGGRVVALLHDNDATIRLHRVTDWCCQILQGTSAGKKGAKVFDQ